MSTTPHKERTHATLSPSKASTWAVCTASTKFIADNADRIPPEKPSKWADEGTMAHEVAESLLLQQPNKMPAKATDEMLRHGAAYVKFIKSLGGKFVAEQEAPLWYAPGDTGHVDCFVTKTIRGAPIERIEYHVVDYKYGAGVKVSAQDNLQMAIYAAGMLFSQHSTRRPISGDNPVSMHIFQPRCQKDEDEQAHSTWETTWGELQAFVAKHITAPAKQVQSGKGLKFSPGEKACRWCPAKQICQARSEWLMAGSGVDFFDAAPLPTTDGGAITDEQIGAVLARRSDIREWLDSLEEYAKARYDTTNPLPGWKLVRGKGSRSWSDKEKAHYVLEHAGVPRTELFSAPQFISPAQAEKIAKEHKLSPERLLQLAALVERHDGAPTLAPESDKRTALPRALSYFEDDGADLFL